MEPNERERMDLAGRIRAVRLDRYEGNRRAAYNEAGVNAATWDSAESGARLAERSLVKIVKTLWPETGGDWTQLQPPLGGTGQELSIEDEVRRAELAPATKEYLLRVLAEDDARRKSEGGVKDA